MTETEKTGKYIADFKKHKIKEKKPKRPRPPRDPERKSVKEMLGGAVQEKEDKINMLLHLILIVILISTFILYGTKTWDNTACFIFAAGFTVVRSIAYITYKLTSEDTLEIVRENKDNPKLAEISFITFVALFTYGFVMGLNLMLDFNLFTRMGLVDTSIMETAYSITSWTIGLVIVGLVSIANNWDAMSVKGRARKKGGEIDKVLQDKRNFVYISLFMFVIAPIFILTFLIPGWIALDEAQGAVLFGGNLDGSSHYAPSYEGQALDDWFGYTLYIFLQAPIPSIMLAMMLFGGMVVILVQNQRGIGRTATGFAVAFISITPMLIVFAAFSGSIAPPDLLMTVVGLSYSIAAIIHGMGLAMTYLFGVSLLGVFISTSRALAGSWSPS